MMGRPIIIGDMFAGGGGVGAAVDRIDGVRVGWAANHWPAAVEHHARMHPDTEVVCQDLCQYDYRLMPDIDLLWASSACQGHSEAAQPARARDASVASAHDHLRTTAWAVIAGVLAKQPRAFIFENVREFIEWSPPPIVLEKHATRAQADAGLRRSKALARKDGCADLAKMIRVIKRKDTWDVIQEFEKGLLFKHWLETFRLAGYKVTVQICNAARWGVAQNRYRLIIVGHREREVAIVEPTLPEATVEPILDFAAGKWTPIAKITKPGVRRRTEHADRTFKGKPCWGYHVSHTAAWARGLDQPSTTVTTQNHHYMVHQGRYRLWSVEETAEVMSFPRHYFDGVPRSIALKMAGNAVPPIMAQGIIEQVTATI